MKKISVALTICIAVTVILWGSFAQAHSDRFCWEFYESEGNLNIAFLTVEVTELSKGNFLCKGICSIDGSEFRLMGNTEKNSGVTVFYLNLIDKKLNHDISKTITMELDSQTYDGIYTLSDAPIFSSGAENSGEAFIADGTAVRVDCQHEELDFLNVKMLSDDSRTKIETQSSSGLKTMDIKADGSDGPLTILPNRSLKLTITLDPGTRIGDNADWWVLDGSSERSPRYLHLATMTMKTGVKPTHMGPLFNLGTVNLNLGSENLSVGPHTFFFCIDFSMNDGGVTAPVYGDSVDVYVDPYEPNNTLEAAWYPGENWEKDWLSTISGTSVQQDDDWYKIVVSSGYERVKVDCRFTDENGDIDIALYDSSGKLLKSSRSSTDNELIDYTVPNSGTYYIKVFYDNEGNSYDLWWDDLKPGDSTAPTTSIKSGPSGTVTDNDVTFTYSGSDNETSTSDLVYSYYLDGLSSTWSSYSGSTSKTFSDLANGSYTFKVRAKDEAGNVDASPAKKSFTVHVNSSEDEWVFGTWGGDGMSYTTLRCWKYVIIYFDSNYEWSAAHSGKLKSSDPCNQCSEGTICANGSYSVNGSTIEGSGYYKDGREVTIRLKKSSDTEMTGTYTTSGGAYYSYDFQTSTHEPYSHPIRKLSD
jgi:hypothetical protein